MTDLTIRPAREADAEAIAQLIEEADLDRSNLDWHRFVIGEIAGGKIIGCGQLKLHDDGSLELASIAITGPHRRQGVGHQIINHLLTASGRPLYLICRSHLYRFYIGFGFVRVGWGSVSSYFRSVRWVFWLDRLLNPVGRHDPLIIMRLG